MVTTCIYLLCFIVFLCVVILAYYMFDLNYFLRTSLSFILTGIKKKAYILEETFVTGVCLTTDLDTLGGHMNNARYLRELDFARIDFFYRTGMYEAIRAKGGSIAMGATTIRYRRFIKLYNIFQISSKILSWNAESFYMEHRFITPRDKFINAIVLTKTRTINCSCEEVMAELLKQYPNERSDVEISRTTTITSKPELPEEVLKWLESNEISSKKLRGMWSETGDKCELSNVESVQVVVKSSETNGALMEPRSIETIDIKTQM